MTKAIQNTQTFPLSVIRPVKGSKGELICELSLTAQTVTEAVGRARAMFEGSGYLVLQTSALRASMAHTEEGVA